MNKRSRTVNGGVQRISHWAWYTWGVRSPNRRWVAQKVLVGSIIDGHRLGIGSRQIDTLKRKCCEEGFW